MRLRAFSAMTAIAALLLAGCSDEEPPNGTQPPVDTPTVSVPGDPNGAPSDAPKVAKPVQNVAKFMTTPCDMLTKGQASALRYDSKIESEPADSQGPRCRWRSADGSQFSIVLLKNQPLGIAGLYRNHQQDPEFYAYFEQVDIAGFPGVFADALDDRPDGACGLAVGVTDQQVISVVSIVEGASDPCAILKSAAQAAVTTMSAG